MSEFRGSNGFGTFGRLNLAKVLKCPLVRIVTPKVLCQQPNDDRHSQQEQPPGGAVSVALSYCGDERGD